jgi:serine/threonine protein kinase/tetratricopeptide (TPR) repeat protein
VAIKCPKCHSDNPDTKKFCGECGTQLLPTEEISAPTETLEAPKEELTTGSIFASRYQIIEELGKGGMGKVYRAVDKKLKEEVALKLIKPEIASDKKTIERFSNELKFARKVAHKNVGRMYELMEDKGTHYITMEYVPGEDLKSTIRRVGPLGVGKTIFIAKQICEGLTEAHRLGVVHRDLKPQNIMIDKEGNARIMDFGIARSIIGKGITDAGVMIGTPEYMSPEQAEVKEVDQRSDIYSLGVILYEMVTGRVPFEGETPLSIAMRHKSEMPKDPREINTQIPEDLSRVILRCMEKDKEKRYQSAGEVHSELEKLEKGIPTTERVVPKRKPITSREITVTFGLKKLFIPALVVVALLAAAVIIWQLLPQMETVPSETGKPSIAVLPFEDLSPQKDQGYLCDGLAESLINMLTKIKDLRIPARTSSFSFKGKERNIQEIGQELNVETVLEGSIQKSGNRIRITVKLINALDESLLWSEQYNREINDIFAIQDEISLAIVDTLKVSLLGEEKSQLTKRYTESVEAYNLYLQGRFFWNKRTEEGLSKAETYFEKAIAADPNFALGYAGLADVYNMFGDYAILPKKEVSPKAREAASKALELDNTLCEAHTSLAWIKLDYDWDWEGAEREFKRAIELNPGYATAHLWYSWMLLMTARFDEGIEEIRIAMELDPLSPLIREVLGEAYYFSGQYDQAIDECKKTLVIESNIHNAHHLLGRIYVQKSMFEEAIREFQKAIDLSNRKILWYLGDLGYAFGIMGNKDKAIEILEELHEQSKQRHVSNIVMVLVYLGLGEEERALDYLEKGIEEHEVVNHIVTVDPSLRKLRQHPRFKAILEKMNLK